MSKQIFVIYFEVRRLSDHGRWCEASLLSGNWKRIAQGTHFFLGVDCSSSSCKDPNTFLSFIDRVFFFF